MEWTCAHLPIRLRLQYTAERLHTRVARRMPSCESESMIGRSSWDGNERMKMVASCQHSKWLAHYERRPQAALRLVCIPFAGGGVAAFRLWEPYLPASVELVTVQLPGRESRVREAPMRSVAAVVEEVAPLVLAGDRRPMVIFGHSVGAIIGFELARRLQEREPGLVRHLAVSGRGAPQVPVPSRKFELDDDTFRVELASYGGTPASVLADRNLMAGFLPGIRADFEINETYRYVEGPNLTCPLTVFAGTDDPLVPCDWVPAWVQNTTNRCDIHWIEGGHFFIRKRLAEVLVPLLQALRGHDGAVQPAAAASVQWEERR
jgi:medium-chain acyl-[acyl-carrier-protein] hydrolase